MRSEDAGWRSLAGLAGVAGPIVFTLAWIIGSIAQDHYSIRREDISALSALTADSPWLMMGGFLIMGACTILLGISLMSLFGGSRRQRIGPGLITLAGLGMMLAGVFRNDCSSALDACKVLVDAGDVSWHHNAHDGVSILVFLALIIAPLVMAGRFLTRPDWASLRLGSMMISPVLLLLLVLFGSEAFPSVGGIIERVMILLAMGWLAVLGAHVFTASKGPT
jgi:hypothetical membrane protein